MKEKLAFWFFFFLIFGYATASNSSEWPIHYYVGDVTPTFEDMNVFEWQSSGIYTQDVDLNAISDFNIVFDFNVSGPNLNYDSVEFYYTLSHGADDSNCFMSIRNTEFCGWKNEIFDLTLLDFSGTERHYLTESEDDHAFKHSSYNLDADVFSDRNTTINLTNNNVWFKTLITNAKASNQQKDSNVLFNYSFSANYIGTLSRNLKVYDCNYNSSNPVGDEQCNSFTFSSSSTKELDNYYSILNVSNDQNEIVQDFNVKLNKDGNHWFYFNCENCNATKYWSLDAIDTNSNIDRERNWNTSTGLGGLIPNANTGDIHIHRQELSTTHTFAWIAQISNIYGTDYNSPTNFEVINVVNLPPTVIDINQPVEGSTVSGNVDVTALVHDPNEDTLVCDFYIFNEDGEVEINSIGETVTNNVCSFNYDSTTVHDKTHFASVVVRETLTANLFYADFNQDLGYTIDNNNPAPIKIIKPPRRYYGGYDNRPVDSNRYFNQDDPRNIDENRFIGEYDPRKDELTSQVDENRFFSNEDPRPKSLTNLTSSSTSFVSDADLEKDQSILLYLTIGVILTVMFVIAWKVLS